MIAKSCFFIFSLVVVARAHIVEIVQQVFCLFVRVLLVELILFEVNEFVFHAHIFDLSLAHVVEAGPDHRVLGKDAVIDQGQQALGILASHVNPNGCQASG